jgi:hypothetical protein
MKFSAQITMVMAAIFSSVCFGFAVRGFTSLREIVDPVVASDAQGYAWFWAFLGLVGAVFAVVSWWIARTEKGDRG